MLIDLPPPLWVPQAPAIIRPAEQQLASEWFRSAPKATRRFLIKRWVASGRLSKADAANTLVRSCKVSPVMAMLMVNQLIGFGAGGIGGNDGYTKLLLHFDGADAATTTTDSSPSPKTVTFSGSAQLDTAQFKFGTASLLLDGTDDYVYIEDTADIAFGTGDFTFDFWMKRAAVSGAQENTFGQGNAGLTGGYHYGKITAGNTMDFAMNDDALLAAGPAGAPLNNTNLNHIAVVRSGNNLAVAVNGTWGANTDVTAVTYTDSTARFAIGQLGEFTDGSSFNGWIDEFRISKGIARWSPGTSFTPPTEAYA